MILAELILVTIKWLHFNSIIPSISIGWYSFIRGAYPLFCSNILNLEILYFIKYTIIIHC